MTVLRGHLTVARDAQPMLVSGRVAALRGLTVLVDELPLPVGSTVSIRTGSGSGPGSSSGSVGVLGEIVGFTNDQAAVMLFGAAAGIRPGDRVEGRHPSPAAPVGPAMLGRIVNALAEPIDESGPIPDTAMMPIDAPPIGALRRERIDRAMTTGVRAIDLMTTLGRGQRLGIFAGPGVGKSTLLGSIARGTAADVNVIALIGERGREVREFVEHSLGSEGLRRSVVVVATGDEPPLMRIRAARLACAIAELFRDRGQDVMLMMDSITRFAHAQRQVGLSVGEPPATKGYTPSVFAELPVLLERAGPSTETGGSVTGLYTVLVEGDDMTEPVADAARGILDGHVILSRSLAQRNHFPAIDVLDSVSRVADQIIDDHHRTARNLIRQIMAAYANVEELVQIGAYARGSDPDADVGIAYRPRLVELLTQGPSEADDPAQSRDRLIRIAAEAGEHLRRLRAAQGPQSAAQHGEVA
ncbi:MAG: FliI/YscN family ATPase [Planctomycetota bacterium]